MDLLPSKETNRMGNHLCNFLSDNHSNLDTKIKEAHTVNVVLGNASCDLDSAVCSLVYCFYLKWQNSLSKPHSNCELFLPVFNIDRKDFHLKTEVIYYLLKHNLDLDLLLFRDEIDLQRLATDQNKLHLILVDHHILGKHENQLEKFVVSIFDHRPVEKSKWKYDENKVVWRIEQVASCATIICSEIVKSSALAFLENNIDCAALLYGTIIVDSVNLQPYAGKVKELDIEIVYILEDILKIEQCDDYRFALFKSIADAKNNISKLRPIQMLNKDSKSVGDVLIPSLPLLVREFLLKENAYNDLVEYAKNQYLKVVILLGIETTDTGILRDMAIYFQKRHPFVDKLMLQLLNHKEPPFELSFVESHSNNIILFKQNNVRASRKQILPVITQIYEEFKFNFD